MPVLARQIARVCVFLAAILTFLIVSRYLTLNPSVYFPEQSETYQSHQTSLLLHVVSGMTAIILGPFQFIQGLRTRFLTLHKVTGRVYVVACVTGAGAGMVMATRAFGGFPSSAGFGMLAALWLTTVVLAVTRVRQGNIERHREWMIRSYALTLAAFSFRMILTVHGVLEATEIIKTPYVSAYQATAWLCWVPNLLIAECYINATRDTT